MCNTTRLREYVNVEDERMKCEENKYFTLYVVLCVWEWALDRRPQTGSKILLLFILFLKENGVGVRKMKVAVCMPFIFKFVCHVIFICTLQKVRRSFAVWPGTSSFWEKWTYEFRWFGMRNKFMQECSVARVAENMTTNILKSSFKNVRRKIRSWGKKSEQNETELKLLNVKGEEQWRKKQQRKANKN